MANKTRPPRHRLRARRAAAKPVNHAARFEAALGLVELEDFVRADVLPCVLCASPTSSWAARLSHRADGSARLELMHLCRPCREAGGVEKLDVILDSTA
jgi:hypothetical protein